MAVRAMQPDMDPVPLSLDVHLLISLWTNSADDELAVLAWMMRELHQHPVLDASTLVVITLEKEGATRSDSATRARMRWE